MQTVALIDYGSGNLRSAEKALQKAASAGGEPVEIRVTDDPEVIAVADRIVLPGVGAFGACMTALQGRPGLVEAMTEAVHTRGAPFLGVCVGMQLLATRGLEFGPHPGLDWIPGEVRRLEPDDPTLKVPHMGWNDVEASGSLMFGAPLPREPGSSGPVSNRPGASQMYFTHSYAFYPDDSQAVAATCDHGGRFAAAVVRGNIAGVQFHPEKSQASGIQLISQFLAWRP